MLVDMIKQLTPTLKPAVVQAAAVSERPLMFDKLFGPAASQGKGARQAEAPRRSAPGERAELGSGWETADAALAAAQESATPQAQPAAAPANPPAGGQSDPTGPVADEAGSSTQSPAAGQADGEPTTPQGGSPAQEGKPSGQATMQPAELSVQLAATAGLSEEILANLPAAGLSEEILANLPAPSAPAAEPSKVAAAAPQADAPVSQQQPAVLAVTLAIEAPADSSADLSEMPMPSGPDAPDWADAKFAKQDGSEPKSPKVRVQAPPQRAQAATPRPAPVEPVEPAGGAAASNRPAAPNLGQALSADLGERAAGTAALLGRGEPSTTSTPHTSPAPVSTGMAGTAEPDMDHLAARTVRWQHLGVLDRGGTARIRLSPPELGSVQVALHTMDNVVRVQLTVENESVRQLLQGHSERLVQSLQAHGLSAGRVQVSVETPQQRAPEQDPGGGQGRQEFTQDDQPSRQGRQGRPFRQTEHEELNLTA